MATQPLDQARVAFAAGQPALAIDLIWKSVRSAVLAQDSEQLTQAISLAQDIAVASDGESRIEAEQLAAYCAACLAQPRDALPSVWSLKQIFNRGSSGRKKCPDCAEKIAAEARVCRFCGYRYMAD